ncbi:18219_t:CDS:2, partial [Racocetra fulgida]
MGNSIKAEQRRMDVNDENHRREMEHKQKELEFEKLKAELEQAYEKKKNELRDEVRKREIEAAKNKHELEKGKAMMEHHHKISELIMQIQQTKQQNGKDIIQTYLGTVNDLIQKNIDIHRQIFPLIDQINDEKYDKIPRDIKEAIHESIKKTLKGAMSPKEIMDYSKTLLNNLQLNHNEDLKQMLGTAIRHNLLSEGEVSYLLGETSKIE